MMTIDEYFDSIKVRLLSDPLVASFRVIRERVMATEGHLRARLTLEDGSLLEFSEYVRCGADVNPTVVIYSYHWCDVDGKLRCRWDNTPHFPDLPNYPHHIHRSESGDVIAGELLNIFAVLDEISVQLSLASQG